MRHVPGILPAFLTLSLTGALAGQQPALGPLTAEEGAPLQRISFVPSMEGPDVTSLGELATDMWLGYSNIFEQDSAETHELLMDMERLLTAVTVRWGAAKNLELGARLTLETSGGGILDPFVLWYHERLGLGQANRDRFPSGAFGSRLTNGRETLYLDARSRTLGLEDVRLFLKWRARSSSDGRSAFGVKAVAWIPAQSHRVGERRPDVALLGLGRVAVGSWYLHGMLGASTARTSPELNEIVRAGTVSASIGVERSLGPSLAAVVQYQIASPLLSGFHHRELDGPVSNIVFGLAGRWGDAWRWDVGFQEDLPADTPAVDFTLGARVSRIWQ